MFFKRLLPLILLALAIQQAWALDIKSIVLEKHKYFDNLVINTSDYIMPSSKLIENPPLLVVDFKDAEFANSFKASLIKSTRISEVKRAGSKIVIELNRPIEHEIASLFGKNQVTIELREKAGTVIPAREAETADVDEREPLTPKKAAAQKAEEPTAKMSEIPPSGLLEALDKEPAKATKAAKAIEVKKTAETVKPVEIAGGSKIPVTRRTLGSKNEEDQVGKAARSIQSIERRELRSYSGVLKGKTVFIDAGHGGGDPGAIANGLNEKDLTLQTVLELAKILRSAGARVLMTRNTDKKVGLPDVAEMANRSRADIFVSVHYNFIENSSKKGTETYYCTGRSAKLAEAIHKSLLNGIHRQDRGVRTAKFYVIHHTTMPSVLLEPLYLSNYEDSEYAKRKGFYKEIAQDIAGGIKEYFR